MTASEADGWRPMRQDDLSQVVAIADEVHLNMDEPPETYRNRLSLYPSGCLSLQLGGNVAGYLISHPWRTGKPPKLGQIVSQLPLDSDCFYLHDIALLPAIRGHGAGKEAFQYCLELAKSEGFDAIELVAVNGADTYWGQLGFNVMPSNAEKDYGTGSALMRLSVKEST